MFLVVLGLFSKETGLWYFDVHEQFFYEFSIAISESFSRYLTVIITFSFHYKKKSSCVSSLQSVLPLVNFCCFRVLRNFCEITFLIFWCVRISLQQNPAAIKVRTWGKHPPSGLTILISSCWTSLLWLFLLCIIYSEYAYSFDKWPKSAFVPSPNISFIFLRLMVFLTADHFDILPFMPPASHLWRRS